MARRTEFWLQATPDVRSAAAVASAAEKAGWDGVQFADGRSGDVFVALTAAAAATSTLRLATGVVNPVVRHPAVLASAISSVAALAGPRVVLGLGRGDSSVRTLGLAEEKVTAFGRTLGDLRTLLGGGYVGGPGGPHVPWLVGGGLPAVPVDVAATGPRVIELSARLADRTTLALGADPERIRWGIGLVRSAAEGAPVGAAVAVGIAGSADEARRLAAGPLSVTAHFAGATPLSGRDAAVVAEVGRVYEYAGHARGDSAQAAALPPDFIDRNAVAGSPAACADRLADLAALGLSRVVLIAAPGRAGMPHVAAEIADRVLSRLR